MSDKDYTFITFNCFTMDLSKVLHGGFDNGHGFIRDPNSIRAAGALTAVAIQSAQNSQFGGVAISGLDFSLAEYVEKSWRKILKKQLDHCTYITNHKILSTINYDICKFCQEGHPNYLDIKEKSIREIQRCTNDRFLSEKIFLLAIEDIIEETEQSMEALIHNLCSLHSRAGN